MLCGMNTGNRAWLAVFALLLLLACGRRADLRPYGEGTDRTAPVFPDYREVTVPGNIAPLNFYYTDPQGSRFVTTFTAAGQSVTIRGRDVVWKEKEWARILATGADMEVSSQYKTPSGPMSFTWTVHVSPDPIDGYLTYRLIEPGFEVWDDLEIVAMFYLRGEGGGAILNRDGKLRKLTLKDSTMISATVYGEIHPGGRYGVFSTNVIIPGMHSYGNRRMEVFDTASDLCVADFDGNRMQTFPETARPDVFETFPVFSADGNWVYYCAAPVKNLPAEVEQTMYSLVRRPFDAETGTLGAPADTLWSASERGLSVCHPKASPDGRWLMFTVADYGTFPLFHPETTLYLVDLRSGEVRPMDEIKGDKSGRRNVRQALVQPCLGGWKRYQTFPPSAERSPFL